MDFLTALLVDRHKRGRLRHRGAALDAAKGLIEGKSLDVVVSDVGTSVLLSKSVGQFVKNEDAKRLITSGAKKVIESIQSKSETPNNEVKNEAK